MTILALISAISFVRVYNHVEDNINQVSSKPDLRDTSSNDKTDSPSTTSSTSDSQREFGHAKFIHKQHPMTSHVSTNDEADDTMKSEAQRLYETGIKILNEADTQPNMRKLAFQFFHEAAQRGYQEARGWAALGTLLGWGFYQSLPRAHTQFVQLANEGDPKGQFGLGFMYAAGLMVNVSIPHALMYFTFSALGGDELSEMALAYRHWTGTGLEENCESALTYYHRVAKKVAKQLSDQSLTLGTTMQGPLVRRVRLLEEVDHTTGLLNVLFGFNAGTGADNDVTLGGLAINDDLFQYYQFMADKRNSSAQVVLGQFYYYGRHGVEKDLHKAFYYFSMAAEAGSSLAKAYLGEMYMTGTEAVKADPSTGLKYLRQSADDNNPVGQTGLAMAYLNGKAGLVINPVKAMELLLKAAEQGWADAQLTLGRMFMGTLGMKADYKLALKYFTLASQQGNTLALFYLGEMHATGMGVLRSCTTAAELFKNVAERGRWSKWLMYAYSAYRSHRYDEAFVTYQLLSELGYEVAQSNAAFMLEEGKITVVPESEFAIRALVQWQRSATQGSTTSRVKLGDCYYYGVGTEVDYDKAVQQYRIASDVHQNSQAMFNLAYMHEQGLGLKRDIHLAKRYYDMAVESSLDAKIPVYLALLKLSIAFGSEYLREMEWLKHLMQLFSLTSATNRSDHTVSNDGLLITMDWDYYVIPFLTGLLLTLIVYLRNGRRH